MIYLDYTATTPVDKEVLDTYIKTQNNFFASSNSLHKLGQLSFYMYEKATNEIKNDLSIPNHNLIYTSNATEANNLGVFGIVEKFNHGKVITTKIEHPSVFEIYKKIEGKDFEVVYLDVDEKGIIDLKQLQKELNSETILVSIMWVNNIVGSIQPINEIIKLVKKYPKTKLHVDIVQGICKLEPEFNFSEVDILTFSGHKIYAPKGIGVLAVKDKIELEARIFGANNQYKVKPGTLDLALIVALSKAIKLNLLKLKEHYEYVKELNLYFRDKVKDFKKIIINSPLDASPYIMNISIMELKGSTLLNYLEAEEIYVSTGSACSSKTKKLERTVYAMTNSEDRANSSIRISFSHLTTKDEINKLIEVLEKI